MSTLRTLIVDDEPGIRSGITRILQHHSVGYPFLEEDFTFELSEAATGEEALQILQAGGIDIVLLDNQLPGISGVEILEQIRKQNIKVEVMMITSYASLELAVKATGQGAYNFVPKPFTPQELKTAVEGLAKHLFLKRMAEEMGKEGRETRFQFLSVLSHELKSPVNAVEGYLRIMLDRQVGSDISAYEVMINRSLERLKGMRTLITDLLDLTRIESGTRQKGNSLVDMDEIVRIALDTMDPLARQKELTMNYQTNGEVFIQAGRDDMQMIANNLISNAVKYNIEKGEVDIHLAQKDGRLIFTVRDSGIGISEDESKLLFQEFVRIKNERTRNISGSGLGLSIVRKLVEMYEGHISVISKPDQGSTFRVELPANAQKKSE
jgi:two-component system, sensor histidine kinase and response regulator